MIPADWEEYLARLEREQKKTPYPVRRRQPRVKRMQSPRMRIVSAQTANLYKAMFDGENRYNATPLGPKESSLTRNMPLPQWNHGKDTRSRNRGSK